MPSEKSPDTAGLPLFDPDPDPAESVNTISATSDNNVEGAPIFPAFGGMAGPSGSWSTAVAYAATWKVDAGLVTAGCDDILF